MPTGATVAPQGAVILPTGATLAPQGAAILPTGATLAPQGAVVAPQGAAILPTGAVVGESGNTGMLPGPAMLARLQRPRIGASKLALTGEASFAFPTSSQSKL